MPDTITVSRRRYSFVKDGQASPWYELPDDQAGAAARKHFVCTIPLWKHLINVGKVRRQSQRFNEDDRTWGF